MNPNLPSHGARAGTWDWVEGELADLLNQGLIRGHRTTQPLPGGKCRVWEGSSQTGLGAELWDFASNDYLGLAHHPRLAAAAQRAIAETGTGARASALICGHTVWHERLEQALATFKQTEAALLFPSGFAANLGTIPALVGAGDVVLCDRLNHASLIDGCRLSGAKFRVYPHCDVNVVERELHKHADSSRKLVVTDSLFSMDGDAAPLNELIDVTARHGAMLLVDEAHATGVFGERGTGLLESCPHAEHVLSMGTLSKGLGAQGGFLAGPHAVIEWLWNSARTQMFSTALTPAACAAALEALQIVQEDAQPRRQLLETAARFCQQLRAAGWQVPENVCGPIIPVLVGEPEEAVRLASQLRQAGFLVPAIRPPTVPKGTSRLRISLSAAHSQEACSTLMGGLKPRL